MVGQQLPQTNEKCYSILQCPMWLFYHHFTDLNTTKGETAWSMVQQHSWSWDHGPWFCSASKACQEALSLFLERGALLVSSFSILVSFWGVCLSAHGHIDLGLSVSTLKQLALFHQSSEMNNVVLDSEKHLHTWLGACNQMNTAKMVPILVNFALMHRSTCSDLWSLFMNNCSEVVHFACQLRIMVSWVC